MNELEQSGIKVGCKVVIIGQHWAQNIGIKGSPITSMKINEDLVGFNFEFENGYNNYYLLSKVLKVNDCFVYNNVHCIIKEINQTSITTDSIPLTISFLDDIGINFKLSKRHQSEISEIKYKIGQKIEDYINEILKVEKDESRIKWLKIYNRCVLPYEVKCQIEEAITVVLSKDKFEEWGINKHFEKGITNSILIYGPPGTGKTMISETIASVLGKNLMKLGVADVESNVPGKTERNIKEAFKNAKDNDAVIMLDECDTLLANRNSVGVIMGGQINALLTELENFSGVCILTTNRIHELDDALSRRIISKIKLDMPNKEQRESIWKSSIPNEMPIKDIDFDLLSEAELSGGEIKNCVLLSARRAISQAKDKVEMEQFINAIKIELNYKKDFQQSKPKSLQYKMDKTREVVKGLYGN